jgi:signal transduction histidine kinase
MTSLRRRLFIGSVLWTVGMVVVASAAFSVLMDHSPQARMVIAAHLHGTLQSHIVLAAALLCLAGGAWQVHRGLQRIDDLRDRLSGLHQGRGHRLEGEYPAEVQPLVDDLNALLAHRDEAVRRAVGKAGDLAHGLKTPLAVLSREADAAGADGRDALAASMRQQVDRMRRQIDYHLAHARAAASAPIAGTRSSVRESVNGIARVMERIYAERNVALSVDCPDGHSVRVQREDLDEMLGNLVDNACKWARTRVRIASTAQDGYLLVTIDDDGHGIAGELRAAVLQRGVRADEGTPGSGLGLAIVRDLAEAYRGTIDLAQSPDGGCRATLQLPSAIP